MTKETHAVRRLLRRVESGDLAGGAEDHTTFMLLRTCLRRGMVSREILEHGVRWAVTDDGLAMLRDRRRKAAVAAPDWSARDRFRAAKVVAGEG